MTSQRYNRCRAWHIRSRRHSPGAQFRVDIITQLSDLMIKRTKLVWRVPGCVQERIAHAARPRPERAALVGQIDDHLTLIVGVPRPPQQPRAFQPLEQRRQGTRFKGEFLADMANRLLVLLPQHVQHEVLRIGQAELIQPGLVQPLDGHARGVNRVADLVVERHGVV